MDFSGGFSHKPAELYFPPLRTDSPFRPSDVTRGTTYITGSRTDSLMCR